MGVILTGANFDNDKIHAEYFQDNTRILESNKEQRKNSDENWNGADPDIKHVGKVPRLIWMLWEQMGITQNPTDLCKALERHPEWKSTTKRLA